MNSDNPSGMVRQEPQNPVTPTVGRIVLYTSPKADHNPHKGFQPYPAVVTHVWTPTSINVHVQNDPDFPLPTESLMVSRVDFADKPGETLRTWSWPPRVAQ